MNGLRPTSVVDAAPARPASIGDLQSPWVEGSTLHIAGPIDSHIYDYLAYGAPALKNVTVVELNSWGGNFEWALEIAAKLRERGVDTVVRGGDACAGVCVALFAAGRRRLAGADTWFGIEGARLGPRYATEFRGACFDDRGEVNKFNISRAGCAEFLGKWSGLVGEATGRMFRAMESNGVDPRLKRSYDARPDEPDWATTGNVYKKPKWAIRAGEAKRFDLVTEIVPD